MVAVLLFVVSLSLRRNFTMVMPMFGRRRLTFTQDVEKKSGACCLFNQSALISFQNPFRSTNHRISTLFYFENATERAFTGSVCKQVWNMHKYMGHSNK